MQRGDDGSVHRILRNVTRSAAGRTTIAQSFREVVDVDDVL